jgi:hypothetical protein
MEVVMFSLVQIFLGVSAGEGACVGGGVSWARICKGTQSSTRSEIGRTRRPEKHTVSHLLY